MAWLGTWANREAIVIDNADIDNDLTHFPVALNLGTSVGKESQDLSGIFTALESDANRKKIAITKSDGITQLYGEIETWDHANKKAVIWFSKSDFTISSSAKTQIYFYYDKLQSDNTTYIGDTGDTAAKNVWDSNFKAVYHMAQDPSGGANCILDSTTNENHGTPTGSMTTSDLVDGKIGKAIDFDGSDDFIIVPRDSSLEPTEVTLEAFGFFTGGIIGARILRKYGSAGYILAWDQGLDGRVQAYFSANTTLHIEDSVANTNYTSDWHSFVATCNSSYSKLYIDSVIKDSVTGDGSVTHDTSVDFTIMAHLGGDEFTTGKLQEARVSGTARTQEWIKATNKTLEDSLLFRGSLFSGTITADGEGVSREINFYKEPDLSASIGSVTSEADGTWEIVLDVTSGNYVTAVCEGEGSEQSQVFNKISVG